MNPENNSSVAGVIVTYNRLPLLKECVQALFSQTRQLNKVIVVDNGSNDETKNWLHEAVDMYRDKLLVVHQANTGGAGGFHRGIKEAYALEYDWIWLMDDDAIPESDCLLKMFAAISSSGEKLVAVAPEVVEHGRVVDYHRGMITFMPDLSNIQKPHEGDHIQFASFVGLMLSRTTIGEIGLPLEKFFIFHDDVEYCSRMINLGSIRLVRDAYIIHKTKPLQDLLVPRRLLWLRFKRYKIEYLSKQYFDKRNLIWLKKKHFLNVSVLQYIRFSIRVLLIFVGNIGYVVLAEDHKMKRIKFYYKTFRNGYLGIFENDIKQIIN